MYVLDAEDGLDMGTGSDSRPRALSAAHGQALEELKQGEADSGTSLAKN
jgi:hypothetical protein